jgi:hypothetical protein
MHTLRYRLLLVLAFLGTFAGAGVAAAQPHGADSHAHAAASSKAEAKAADGKAGEKGAEKAEGPDGKEADVQEHKQPQKITVDVEVEGLSKFEVGPGTFNVEFTLGATCDHEPCKPDFDLGNGRITGKEKLVDETLIKVTKYKAEVTGFVDLAEFPFDKHILFLELQEKSDPLNTTFVLDSKDMKLDPRVRLAGWHLNEKPEATVVKQDIEGGHHYDTMVYGIELQRPRTAAFFKTLLPAFFMVFVMFFTLLVKPKSAATRLTAATGALMTLVMFHISSTGALPPLGYLTRMDKFMIANYFVYLLNIALAVGILRADERKDEKSAEMLYLSALGAVPGVALLAWVIVFMRLV